MTELEELSSYLMHLDHDYSPASHDPREIERALIGRRYAHLRQQQTDKDLAARLKVNISYACAVEEKRNRIAAASA